MGQIQGACPGGQTLSCRNSYGVLEAFSGEVERLVTASLSCNTVKSYNFAVSKFQEFCQCYEIQTNPPPIPTLSSVISFIAWISLNGHKSSTIVTYISGVSYYLKLNGWVDVTEVFIVRKMLKGFAKLFTSKDIRAPLMIDLLKAFPVALRNVATSDYEALLFSTAFVVMFFGFLRVGEVAVAQKKC